MAPPRLIMLLVLPVSSSPWLRRLIAIASWYVSPYRLPLLVTRRREGDRAVLLMFAAKPAQAERLIAACTW